MAPIFLFCPRPHLFAQCQTSHVRAGAVGCILAEMLLGKPLFPGSSTMNQLEKVIEVHLCPTTRTHIGPRTHTLSNVELALTSTRGNAGQVTGMPTAEAVAHMRSPFAKTMLDSVKPQPHAFPIYTATNAIDAALSFLARHPP